jgi:hypothetical protein
MKCSNCGAELKPDATVCDFCGAPVPVEAVSPAAPAPEEYIPPAFPYADDPTKQAEPASVEPEPVDFTPKAPLPPMDTFPEMPVAVTPPAVASDGSGYAITSLVIGILGLCFGFVPICGVILVIIGIILGIMGLKSRQRNLAIAGIVLNVISLCIAVTFMIFFGASWLAALPGILSNQ